MKEPCVLVTVDASWSWRLLQTQFLWHRKPSLHGNNTKLSMC